VHKELRKKIIESTLSKELETQAWRNSGSCF